MEDFLHPLLIFSKKAMHAYPKEIHMGQRYWRRAAVVISLLMVVFAAFFVIVFTHRVDKELHYISLSTQMREEGEAILLDLLEMEKQKERFFTTYAAQPYTEVLKLSGALQNHLETLNTTEKALHLFDEKMNTLKQEISKNLMAMHGFMYWSALRNQMPPFLGLPWHSCQESPDTLTPLLHDFLMTENSSIERRWYDLDTMRTALSFAAIVAIISTCVLAYGVIDRFRRDVYDLRIYRNLLRDKNSQLEARVQERTMQLDAARKHAEKERQRVELLLQDTSHRIGNSLATVSSLLNLQANRSKKEEVRRALFSARDRIQTIATAHRRLRLGKDMETTAIGAFLHSVIRDIKLAVPADLQDRIEIVTEFHSYSVCSRDATTLGIVAGELLTNAIKHAFPNDRKGKIQIFFGKWKDGKLSLVIEDNGVGIKEVLDEVEEAGLGKLVAKQLCLQFGSEPLYQRLRSGGTRVIIPLPNLEVQAKNLNEDSSIHPL